jgi:hypothetical protein
VLIVAGTNTKVLKQRVGRKKMGHDDEPGPFPRVLTSIQANKIPENPTMEDGDVVVMEEEVVEVPPSCRR